MRFKASLLTYKPVYEMEIAEYQGKLFTMDRCTRRVNSSVNVSKFLAIKLY